MCHVSLYIRKLGSLIASVPSRFHFTTSVLVCRCTSVAGHTICALFALIKLKNFENIFVIYYFLVAPRGFRLPCCKRECIIIFMLQFAVRGIHVMQ